MGEQTPSLQSDASKTCPLQITAAATPRRPMELKVGQVEGVSWEVLKAEAKVELER